MEEGDISREEMNAGIAAADRTRKRRSAPDRMARREWFSRRR